MLVVSSADIGIWYRWCQSRHSNTSSVRTCSDALTKFRHRIRPHRLFQQRPAGERPFRRGRPNGRGRQRCPAFRADRDDVPLCLFTGKDKANKAHRGVGASPGERFLRATGPVLYQPRATPWVTRRERHLSPEGATQAPRMAMVRPFRAQWERHPKPRARPHKC
jgi:hypothetical protein